ncbi:hypothetical protein U91I_01340 [alpha proteobacterium U9-1i]|nr:hypothetical protein U91I_01340 [alpha proteobacterium U9-1i]
MHYRNSMAALTAFAALGIAAPAGAQSQPASPPAAQSGATAAYTDAQLSAFVAASAEVQPLTESLAGATPEARTATTAQIGAALTRHNISAADYNSIATSAQTDTALAARINTLRQAGEAHTTDHPAPPASPQ